MMNDLLSTLLLRTILTYTFHVLSIVVVFGNKHELMDLPRVLPVLVMANS